MNHLGLSIVDFKILSAVVPVAVAIGLRFVLGRNHATELMLSMATTWFAINVLLSPFTDPSHVGSWLLR